MYFLDINFFAFTDLYINRVHKKWAHKVPIINQQSNISENAVMPQVDNHNSLQEESLNEHTEFP